MNPETIIQTAGTPAVACSVLGCLAVLAVVIFFYAGFQALMCFGGILKICDDYEDECKKTNDHSKPIYPFREPTKYECLTHEPIRLFNKLIRLPFQSLARNLRKLRYQIYNLRVLLKDYRRNHQNPRQIKRRLDFKVKHLDARSNIVGIGHGDTQQPNVQLRHSRRAGRGNESMTDDFINQSQLEGAAAVASDL
jgi:hypothetical protein